MNKLRAVVRTWIAFLLYATPAMADCARLTAPASFKVGEKIGVMASGFLELRDKHGHLKVTQGVDASHRNLLDYDTLKACGTEFALLKLGPVKKRDGTFGVDESFETHAAEFARLHIPTIPYFYLEVPDAEQSDPTLFADSRHLPEQLAIAQLRGKREAQFFIAELDRLSAFLKPTSLGHLSGTIVALDVEEALRFGTGQSIQKLELQEMYDYGRAYSSMVATWIRTLRSAKPNAVVILYTSPNEYMQYLIHARLSDFEVFRGLPIWFASYKNNGGDGNWIMPDDPEKMRGEQRLCLSTSTGNRCILHQYTAGGTFGIKQDRVHAKTLDLDRLFPVQVVQDRDNKQYVRKAEYIP